MSGAYFSLIFIQPGRLVYLNIIIGYNVKYVYCTEYFHR